MARGSKTSRSDTATAMSSVYNCFCGSDFQDKRYGNGKRLMTRRTGNGGKLLRDNLWRCTVCGREIKQ
jgi:hypothetical protein